MAKLSTWRYVYYVNIIISGLALIAVVLFYHPVRHMLEADCVLCTFSNKVATLAFATERELQTATYQDR
jgi:hypothetical protein